MARVKDQEVTDEQIDALEREAAVAGDVAQVAICRRALGVLVPGDDDGADLDTEVARAYDEAAAMTREEARAECVRVITAARAMEVSDERS